MANYTQHYQLHQWEGSDPFLRTDFNEDFQKIDAALNGLAGKVVQTVSGSYVGTGEYGKDHPNHLEFSFVPKLVVIVINATGILEAGNVLLWGQSSSSGVGGTTNTGGCLNQILTWSGQTLSWYAGNQEKQLNQAQTTYHYFALG